MKNLNTTEYQASLEGLVNYLVYFNLMYTCKRGQDILTSAKEMAMKKVLTKNAAGKVILHSFSGEETIQDVAKQQVLLQVLEGKVELLFGNIHKEINQGMMVSIPAKTSYTMVIGKDSKLLKLEACPKVPQKCFSQNYRFVG